MRYAVQIISEQPVDSPWKPGIYRHSTKSGALKFCEGINQTGGKAQVVKQKTDNSGWSKHDS